MQHQGHLGATTVRRSFAKLVSASIIATSLITTSAAGASTYTVDGGLADRSVAITAAGGCIAAADEGLIALWASPLPAKRRMELRVSECLGCGHG